MEEKKKERKEKKKEIIAVAWKGWAEAWKGRAAAERVGTAPHLEDDKELLQNVLLAHQLLAVPLRLAGQVVNVNVLVALR